MLFNKEWLGAGLVLGLLKQYAAYEILPQCYQSNHYVLAFPSNYPRDGKRETKKRREKYTRTLINYETFLQSEKMNGKFILKGNERGRTLEEKSV